MEDVMRCKVDEENMNMVNKCNGINHIKKLDEVESTKAEMTGVREENIRLKSMLQKIEKDYKTLQMKFIEESNKSSSAILTTNGSSENTRDSDEDQEHELVSLRLGTISESKKNDVILLTSSNSNSSKSTASENDNELKLGLDYNNVQGLKGDDEKNYSRTNKNDLEGVKWPPGKVVKTQRSGDEENTQTSVKRARVCVRARCDTATMNDGCQWRKYGQKIAKGNPCPRAYYRCTVSPTCPVRKQVQRCVEDMSILITTYEGTHNHPLPISATAMASTTSAAASMLLSGSSTSHHSATTTTTTPNPLYEPELQSSTRPNPYYYQNSSSTPFSTIILDLTTPNPTTTSTNFSLYSSNFRSTPMVQGTSLSFGSMDSNMIPFSYGTSSLQNNNQQSFDFGNQLKQQSYQSYLDKVNQGSSQQALTETLTKVITSDPSFRSVIAAAISSMAAANGGTEQ